jgi:circadian clock protein KaiC
MTDFPFSTFQTAVPGLDQILDGGLWEGSLYLLEGLPGTGKTILANQIAFSHAAAGKKTLYVSLISESHGKLVNHMRSMSFFREGLVGSGVYYVSAYRSLVDEGLQGLLNFILGQAKDRGFAFLVIEGFSSADYLKHNILELAEFMHRLNALAASLRCTTLLVSHDQGTDDHPEHTLVDGVIELCRASHAMRTARFMKIHKVRGRDPMLGEHAFVITAAGITVFPRLEAVASRDKDEPGAGVGAPERVAFGVPGLDRMLHGGLVAGGSTAVLGAAGSGKTLIAAKFIEQGLRARAPAIFFGFYEAPERLVRKAAAVGIDLRTGLDAGLLKILWQPPLEYLRDELVWRLLDAVEQHRPRRVAIDGIKGFHAAAFKKEGLDMFLTALTNRLRARGIDTLMTEELPLPGYGLEDPPYLISPMVENAILLRSREFRGALCRFVSIIKMRESDYEASVKELRISDAGIEVKDAPEAAINALDHRAED